MLFLSVFPFFLAIGFDIYRANPNPTTMYATAAAATPPFSFPIYTQISFVYRPTYDDNMFLFLIPPPPFLLLSMYLLLSESSIIYRLCRLPPFLSLSSKCERKINKANCWLRKTWINLIPTMHTNFVDSLFPLGLRVEIKYEVVFKTKIESAYPFWYLFIFSCLFDWLFNYYEYKLHRICTYM